MHEELIFIFSATSQSEVRIPSNRFMPSAMYYSPFQDVFVVFVLFYCVSGVSFLLCLTFYVCANS